MAVSKNTWNKGLNSDLSKLKTQQDTYLDAKNIRVITDIGESTFAVENVKGNKLTIKLPTIQNTYELIIPSDYEGSVIITFERNNVTATIQVDNVQDKTNEDISIELNNSLQNILFQGNQYLKFYYNNNSLILYNFEPMSSNLLPLDVTDNNGFIVQRTNVVFEHAILGWGYYNDNLVLISCSKTESSKDPIDTEGCIWDITFDNKTNNVITSQTDINFYLNPQTALKYVGKLNLSREYAINEHLKCRYESTEITRLIWTDWYNNLRICNLSDPQIWGTPEELFSYLPQHLPQKPIIQQIIEGGTLPTGKYQYFYQLYSTQGAKSTYSPVSSLISLYAGDISKYTTPGTKPGVNSQKSIKLVLNNLDTNYDSIRIGYIVYQIANFPEAFFFDERPIPNTGQITLIHNGNENDIPLDSTEVANLNRPPEIFKTIDVVRNRLFAANALTKYFDPVFDARAYRYNSSRISKMYNVQDTVLNPSIIINANNNTISINSNSPQTLDYSLILDSYDCINPFNNENPDINVNPLSNGNWELASQYKYKSDGVTIGGEGPNISYEFIIETKLSKLSGFPDTSPYIRPAMDGLSDITQPFTDTYTYYLSDNTSLDSMKNPYIESLFTGYSRGEVYRWGIVFFDLYGYPSYVNWIADIKFPFAYDNNGDFGLSNSIRRSELYTKQIGIKFTLNINSPEFQAIKNEITGWSYVRVRRDVNNSTKLGTGYLQPVSYVEFGVDNNPAKYTLVPYERSSDINPVNDEWYYNVNVPGFTVSRTRVRLQTFYSPNFLLRRAGTFISNDYIKMIGRTIDYGGLDPVQYSRKIFTLPSWPSNTVLYYVSGSDFDYTYNDVAISPLVPDAINSTSLDSPINSRNRFPLLGRTYVNYSNSQDYTPVNSIPGLDFQFINMASSNWADAEDNKYMEWGGNCELLSFNTDGPDTSAAQSNTLKLPIYLGSYERYLIDQYGGWLRSNRYNNEYILTNHFQPWDKNESELLYPTGLVTNGVFGGDTYVNYFDWQRSNINYLEGSGYEISNPAGSPPFGLAVFFPCESSFNTELNLSNQHASVRLETATGSNSIFNEYYIYNDALSQENSTNIFISKAFNQTNVKYEPHTIYGTEPKLDNERLDSWREFLLNNALTVNGNYGEINRLVQFKDKLFYYQNDALGVASVDERVLAQEGDTSQTQLGTGTLLQRFDYISTETGSKHSFAVKATGSAIYHYDAFINKLFRYSMSKDGVAVSPLTDVKGLSGFFRTAFENTSLKSLDKILLPPDKLTQALQRVGITSGYNSEYNTVYFTFFTPFSASEIAYTISYNEMLDSFESFYDFKPSLYFNMRKRFLSIDPNNPDEVYVHNIGVRNTFYNQYYPSSIKFRVNDNSDFVKTFDNLLINSEAYNNLGNQISRTITSLGISNDYQIVNQQNVNFIQKIRSWRIDIPRDETNPNLTIKPRISDKYMDINLTYIDSQNGLGNERFIMHDVLTEYSMRSKILPR